MGEAKRHPEDALHDAVDGRLDAAGLAELEAHLRGCTACRGDLESLRSLKAHLAAARPPAPPEGLRAAVRQGLDRAERWATRARWGAVAAGLALASLVWFLLPSPGPSPARVAEDYRALRDGRLTLALRTAEPARMEAFFADQGIGFETRVFDLGMMQYQLTGGLRHSLAGRPSALFAYRGPGGQLLLCQMYAGHTSELPRPGESRERGGIRFHVFRQDEVTLVFWQEGEVVCVLAGEGDAEAMIQLAYAKAVKA
jgi:anti-sigma factor RsiW